MKSKNPGTAIGEFFRQLQRRKVFRAVSFYAVMAWGAMVGAAELLPRFGFTDAHIQLLVIGAVALLPVVALLAWLYELTPSGITIDPEDAAPPPPSVTELATVATSRDSVVVASYEGSTQRFVSDFTIGRDPQCDIVVDEAEISRRHATISFMGGMWYVKDLNSRNGTKLDHAPVAMASLSDTEAIVTLADKYSITLTIEPLQTAPLDQD